jgi:hypothetical protein
MIICVKVDDSLIRGNCRKIQYVRTPVGVKQNTIKLVFFAFFASTLSTQLYGIRAFKDFVLTQIQDNMSEWNDMSTYGLLFQ